MLFRSVESLSSNGIKYFRGSSTNVLERVIKAAEFFGVEIIVEITGDCPFVDPNLVDYMIELLQVNDFEYVSNNFSTSFADGFDVQVYYLETLKRMSKMELSNLDREHVTMKIRQNPSLFKTLNLIAPSRFRRPTYSVTLDTKEDYEVIKKVHEKLFRKHGDTYGLVEITDFLDLHPDIRLLNEEVLRKGYS